MDKLSTEQFPKYDSSKIIFKFLYYGLLDSLKSFLIKGLNFSLPPKKLNYTDYLVQDELFHRAIKNLEVLPDGNLVKDNLLTSYKN